MAGGAFVTRTGWNLITHWVKPLRSFGRRGAIDHQPINRVSKRARGSEELDADKIAIGGFVCGADVPDARIGQRGLAVQHQADGLNGLDRERLMSFDQRALLSEIVYPHRVPGVERSPERSKHFESNSMPSIAWRSHQRGQPITPSATRARRLPYCDNRSS